MRPTQIRNSEYSQYHRYRSFDDCDKFYVFGYLTIDGIPEVLFGHAHQAGAHEEDHGGAIVQLEHTTRWSHCKSEGSKIETGFTQVSI